VTRDEDKDETFLRRWSRRKLEKPEEKKDDPPAPAASVAPALPPVEKLTPGDDFSGFMHPKVEDALRRVALKKLFSDPHFNVADPFEAYSGDFTGGEPIPEAMLASLEQMKQLLRQPEPEPAPERPEEITGEKKLDEPGRQEA
jgi:hypothetical protein